MSEDSLVLTAVDSRENKNDLVDHECLYLYSGTDKGNEKVSSLGQSAMVKGHQSRKQKNYIVFLF